MPDYIVLCNTCIRQIYTVSQNYRTPLCFWFVSLWVIAGTTLNSDLNSPKIFYPMRCISRFHKKNLILGSMENLKPPKAKFLFLIRATFRPYSLVNQEILSKMRYLPVFCDIFSPNCSVFTRAQNHQITKKTTKICLCGLLKSRTVCWQNAVENWEKYDFVQNALHLCKSVRSESRSD